MTTFIEYLDSLPHSPVADALHAAYEAIMTEGRLNTPDYRHQDADSFYRHTRNVVYRGAVNPDTRNRYLDNKQDRLSEFYDTRNEKIPYDRRSRSKVDIAKILAEYVRREALKLYGPDSKVTVANDGSFVRISGIANPLGKYPYQSAWSGNPDPEGKPFTLSYQVQFNPNDKEDDGKLTYFRVIPYDPKRHTFRYDCQHSGTGKKWELEELAEDMMIDVDHILQGVDDDPFGKPERR